MAAESILVVDDSPVTSKVAHLLLTREGYDVRTAGDAEAALEMLRAYRADLVLADMHLPGMDGLEMTRRIKRDTRTRNTTVVAFTAS